MKDFTPRSPKSYYCCAMMSLLFFIDSSAYAAKKFVPRALENVVPEEVGISSKGLERIDAAIEEAITDHVIPGAVVLIGRHGRIAFCRAYGYRSIEPKRVPMTVDTVFDMASLTKVVATTPSILYLAEHRKLKLDDRVSKYLPTFAQNGKSHLTIRQLMTHYSGLTPDNDLSDYKRGYKNSIRNIYRLSLETTPGEHFIYSDVNFIVLGELVKRVSGQRLDKFSQKVVFEALGMSSTSFKPAPSLRKRCAPTTMRDGKWLIGRPHDPRAYLLGGVAGHAGLFSTAADLARYCQMILNGGNLGETRILKARTVAEMTGVNSPPEAPDKRGLGWDINTSYSYPRGKWFSPQSFGHTGYTGTSMWIDSLTNTFVIILTNRVHPYEGKDQIKELRAEIATAVAESIIDIAPTLQ